MATTGKKTPLNLDERTRVDTKLTDIAPLEGRDAFLVQIYGSAIGRRYALNKSPVTLGRGESNDIVLEHDNVSRYHAEITVENNRCTLNDKGSTNGTFVNDQPIAPGRVLASGDLVKIGGTIFKFLAGTDLEGLYFEEIYRMTIIDGLTEIHNKRYLLEFLEREMARCSRYGRPLSLIMFDIDHFKVINDTHGHICGDAVLKGLSRAVNEKVRREELFARYGGEEFAIVMPEQSLEHSQVFAEKIRALVAQEVFTFEGERVPVTISLGVGQMQSQHTQPAQFIKAVDDALYAAKRGGRNRVVVAK